MTLFPRDKIVGVFRGFTEGGLEFHADLVLPYRNEFQNLPMHGQFLLVQLETPEEAVLGRISSLSAEGRLSTGAGEEFNIRAVREDRPVPEDLREQYLKYRVNIRVLGVLRHNGEKLTFVPSHRRLPHVGSPVAFPSDEVLREIAGHNDEGVPIGYFSLGEYVFAGDHPDFNPEAWMQVLTPEVLVKFPVTKLVSRRTFIFARAGFGKSNLNKLLFSKLYSTTPMVEKRGGKLVPVGTVLFDRDGEYFWPDDKNRPGLCDVPALQERLVVFTSRKAPSDFYQSFVAGSVRLDIRRLRPSDVISIALSPEKQDQQNVRKLRGLSQDRWTALVDLIDRHGNDAALEEIAGLLSLDESRQEAEAIAARSNMTAIVRMLHDRSSQLMDMLLKALSEGKLCIVDVSQMRGEQALVLSGLILRRIFDRNQEEFTAAEPRTIPTIAVVEEAQSVLIEEKSGAEPYIAWVKEGRKYDLGAVLITQQPGSIPVEILSQGDNWFVFHLLSAVDLQNVRKANAHFSEDLLSSLLNEPIPGHGIFWSSAGGRAYPVSIRALSFESEVSTQDPKYNRPAIDIYARRLRREFEEALRPAEEGTGERTVSLTSKAGHEPGDGPESGEPIDVLETYKRKAIHRFREERADLVSRMREDGVAWGQLKAVLFGFLPENLDDRDSLAYNLVPRLLSEVFGEQNKEWHSFRNERGTTYVKAGPKPSQ
ncbi:MAG TPA: ATP-binding protein [Firmicutes bacterium]|nr:ATP-binding protein [Bacillota bacterium]